MIQDTVNTVYKDSTGQSQKTHNFVLDKGQTGLKFYETKTKPFREMCKDLPVAGGPASVTGVEYPGPAVGGGGADVSGRGVSGTAVAGEGAGVPG